ncbi:hypothetical protein [Variovorax davisae]|uniref:hypothetical protein n=1 Tax=Variovorax davisae TaxID=3053515 RepID=UPI002575953F|nr:hypothetical protein [Variovorax sp. J22P271]
MKDPVSIGAALTVATLALLSVWKSRPRRWVVAALVIVFFALAALESEGTSKLQSKCIGAECSSGVGIAVRIRV